MLGDREGPQQGRRGGYQFGSPFTEKKHGQLQWLVMTKNRVSLETLQISLKSKSTFFAQVYIPCSPRFHSSNKVWDAILVSRYSPSDRLPIEVTRIGIIFPMIL